MLLPDEDPQCSLTYLQFPTDLNHRIVAWFYYNKTSSYSRWVYKGEERHTTQRDPIWHYYEHLHNGAAVLRGLQCSKNDDDTLTVTPGIVADEDLIFSVTEGTPEQRAFKQNLSTLVAPIIYRDNTDKFYIYSITSELTAVYNRVDEENPQNNSVGFIPFFCYVPYYVIATTDSEHPIKIMMGRNYYYNETDVGKEDWGWIKSEFGSQEIEYVSQVIIQYTNENGGSTFLSKIVALNSLYQNDINIFVLTNAAKIITRDYTWTTRNTALESFMLNSQLMMTVGTTSTTGYFYISITNLSASAATINSKYQQLYGAGAEVEWNTRSTSIPAGDTFQIDASPNIGYGSYINIINWWCKVDGYLYKLEGMANDTYFSFKFEQF